MRILHTNMLRGWGGQSNRILVEALGAARAGHHVALAVPHDSVLAQKGLEAGLDVWPSYRFKPPAQPWIFLPDLRRLMMNLRQFKPDVIHVHGSQDTWLVAAARRLSGAHFPPVIRTKHNIFEWRPNVANRWLYRQIDAFISISSFIDKQIDAFPGIGARPRTMIFSVPDTTRIKAQVETMRGELALPPGAFLWGSTGRLRSEKGWDVLLPAFAELRRTHPHAHLIIAGDGSDRAKLEQLAGQLGLTPPALQFLGFRKDVPAVLRSLDAYVLASRAEGLGTAILEALAAGLPVVATRVGGIPDSVRDGETGLLAESENPASLATAMRRIMEEPELGKRLGKAACEMIDNEFTEPRLVQKTLEFYEEVTGRREHG